VLVKKGKYKTTIQQGRSANVTYQTHVFFVSNHESFFFKGYKAPLAALLCFGEQEQKGEDVKLLISL
jgi:hypothetical protein